MYDSTLAAYLLAEHVVSLVTAFANKQRLLQREIVE